MISRFTLSAFLLLIIPCFAARGDDELFDNDNSTATGDVLESRGEYLQGLGQGSLLRSLSIKQLQEALSQRLQNRKESVEMYYDLKDLREEELEEDRLTASERSRIAERKAPDRLSENQIDRQTGEIYWPSPLNHKRLAPFRKPIEDSLAKRGQKDVIYREFDYLKVHRMIKRIEEALESIEDKMDVREVVALKQYLKQIDYEARFDRNDDRVDY